jgi:hypothetical protein
VQRQSCGGALCHADEVGLDGPALRITEAGRNAHMNGVVDAAAP